jgi:hypothetical protein
VLFDTTKAIQFAIGEIKGYLEPSPKERETAFVLFVRAFGATEAMLPEHGTIRSALDAYATLAKAIPDEVAKNGATTAKGSAGNLSIAVVAIRVVNEIIQPVVSRWTPSLDHQEVTYRADKPHASQLDIENEWSLALICRNDLKALKAQLRDFQYTLMRVAGVSADGLLPQPASEMIPPKPATPVVPPSGARPNEKMVRWLSVRELFKIGRASRKAKNPPGLRCEENPSTLADAELKELWEGTAATAAFEGDEDKAFVFVFDYVADIGDAFDPTMAVAWHIGRKALRVPDDPAQEYPSPLTSLPRAELLVMGGDQVYPFATEEKYRQQTVLPYQLAWEPDADKPVTMPTVVAIPGNHDWLGGIEHFDKLFANNKTFADHWQTVQKRRFWSVKLPQGWWLWGIDTALDDRLTTGQREYFANAAKLLGPGDRVIMCTPVPIWQLSQRSPEKCRDLREVFDTLVSVRKARIPLWLSGDSHFFAQYDRVSSDSPECHVTAGGGGAFLQPTHNLSDRLPLERGTADYALKAMWPTRTDSRGLVAGAGILKDWRNAGMALIGAALHLIFALLLQIRGTVHASNHPVSAPVRALMETLAKPWSWLLLAAVVWGTHRAIQVNSREARLRSAGQTMGYALGLLIAVTLVLVAALRRWYAISFSWPLVLLTSLIGGVLSTALFFAGAAYINGQIKANDTLSYSGAHSARFKHFLRLRIDRDGNLTCYAIGIDPVGKGWFEAITRTGVTPPADPAGLPRLHYVWGRTFPKFDPARLTVVVSISRPEGNDFVKGEALTEVFLRLCTCLIEEGHTIIYGGDPGRDFTLDLRKKEEQRHKDNLNKPRALLNYVADYIWRGAEAAAAATAEALAEADENPNVTSEERTLRAADAEKAAKRWQEMQDPEARLRSSRKTRDREDGETAFDTEIRDLTLMRKVSTADANLRVCIGGALEPSDKGRRLAPGVVEEAYMSLMAHQPLLIAGGFKGASEQMAKSMLGTLEPGDVEKHARHFAGDGVDYLQMMEAFKPTSHFNSRLTNGEYQELLRTDDPDAIVELVMRSVRRTARATVTR